MMNNERWLPAETRDRLSDLCKERKVSQAQLAEAIGVDRSVISRFISGKTDSLSHEHVISIAKYFDVSTDFVLGETDDPGRINYDIGELGLTVKAAENLYTRRVDPAIVCRILEHDHCGELMRKIGLYWDETLSAGYASQNQMMNSLSGFLMGHADEYDPQAMSSTLQTIQAMKQPVYTNERQGILNSADYILQDIKKDGPSHAKEAAMMTKETMQNMMMSMEKGQNGFSLSMATPEMLFGDFIGKLITQLEMIDPPENIKEDRDHALALIKEGLQELGNVMWAAKEQTNDE